MYDRTVRPTISSPQPPAIPCRSVRQPPFGPWKIRMDGHYTGGHPASHDGTHHFFSARHHKNTSVETLAVSPAAGRTTRSSL